jgi:hypothetical protein
MIARDTETELVQDRIPIPDLVVQSFAFEDGATELLHRDDPDAIAMTRDALSQPCCYANAPFDMAATAHAYDLWREVFEAYRDDLVYDVLTREKLIEIATIGRVSPKISLATVAQKHLGVSLDKKSAWRKNYYSLRWTPLNEWPDQAKRYTADDALSTLRVFEAQEPLMPEREDQRRQARAHFALFLISRYGIHVDRERAAARLEKYEAEMLRLDAALESTGLIRKDGTRNIKLAMQMLETEFPDCVRGESGRPSLSYEALEVLDLPQDHPLELFRRRAALDGERTRFRQTFDRETIRCRFDELLVTGRTSSSNPQTQNWAKDSGWRDCAIARPGKILVGCDWSAEELVTLAQVQIWRYGESALADALNAGRDPHCVTAAQILGITYEEAARRKVAKQLPERQLAKAVNFGLPGGMGRARFRDHARQAYGLDLSEAQVNDAIMAWHRAYPEMRRHLDDAGRIADRGGCVVQPGSGRVRAACKYSEASNTVFQGLAADANKDALWRVAWRQYLEPASALYDSNTILFVHDEIVVECEEDRGEAVASELRELMIATLGEWCPDVRGGAEPWIGERYR